MITAMLVVLFGQTLAETNYEFMKNGVYTSVKKAKDADRYEFSATFKFISKDGVKHPFLNKDTINLNQNTTKKFDNNEVFTKISFYSNIHDDDKKVYYYIIQAFGYIKPENMNTKIDQNNLILNGMASTLADMGISFKNIKIDRIIPHMKMYSNGKVVDSFKLK